MRWVCPYSYQIIYSCINNNNNNYYYYVIIIIIIIIMVPISYLPAISMNLHFQSSDDDGTSGPGESVVSSSTINSVEEEDDQSMDADSVEVEQGTPDSDGCREASKE